MAKRVEPLDVWLYGIRIARLTQPNAGRIHYQLSFTEEALGTYREGRRILSLALPVSRKPVVDTPGGHLPVTSFLKGLLPEGNLLQQLAKAQRVPTSDQMALSARRVKVAEASVLLYAVNSASPHHEKSFTAGRRRAVRIGHIGVCVGASAGIRETEHQDSFRHPWRPLTRCVEFSPGPPRRARR